MDRSSQRLKILALLVALMFMALSTRLWYLQVLATTRFVSAADIQGLVEAAVGGKTATVVQEGEKPAALVVRSTAW